jgi:hypothetical protein
LGSLPLWGREGITLTTTTKDFFINSYIEDFYRSGIFRKQTVFGIPAAMMRGIGGGYFFFR